MDLINKYINPQWVYINLVLCSDTLHWHIFMLLRMLYQGKQKLLLKMLVTTLLLVTFFVVIVQWWFLKHMKSLETEMTFLLRKGFDKKFSGSNGWLFQTKHFKNKIHFIWTLPKGRSNTVEKINVQIEWKSKSQMCWCQSTNWEW